MRNAFPLCRHRRAVSPLLLLLPLGLSVVAAHAQQAPEAPPSSVAAVQPPMSADPVEASPAAAADQPVVEEAPAALPAGASTPVAAAPATDVAPAPAQVAAPVPPPAPPAQALAVIPLAPDQAAERQLGARCPVDLAGRLAPQGDLLIGACQGTLPPHLAALLVALPEQDIVLPRSWREREVRQRAWFKAVAGFGQRPDFIARLGDLWVRSFEGADSTVTTYLVSAPFECADGMPAREGAGEPLHLSAGGCALAYASQRVYRVGSDGVPQDVSRQVMPAAPLISDADRARQHAREGRLMLDHSKLQYGPALRWYVQYPDSAQKGGPRSFSDWNREHLAFVVWNGQDFELRETVPRRQWPCDPVAPGDRACGGFPDSGPDGYVTADPAAVSAVSGP